MEVEKQLKVYIKDRFHTMQFFAEKTGIVYSTLVNALRYGLLNCQVKTVQKIADGLGMTIDELLAGDYYNRQPTHTGSDASEFCDFLRMQKKQIETELARFE